MQLKINRQLILFHTVSGAAKFFRDNYSSIDKEAYAEFYQTFKSIYVLHVSQ